MNGVSRRPKCKVAVIGSGLAGLTAACLLSRSFTVHLYERESSIGFDHHSIQVTGKVSRRIDVPMRAFSEGAYPCLIALYRQIGVHFTRQRFEFSFTSGGSNQPYFLHKGHGGLRGFESGMSIWHSFQIVWGYFYFSMLAYIIYTLGFSLSCDFGTFCRYSRLPVIFQAQLLFPLFCALTTCNAEQLASYPADEIIAYKAMSTFKAHYTVTRGVKEVVEKLTAPVHKIFLDESVDILGDGIVQRAGILCQYDFIVDARCPPKGMPTVATTVITHTDPTYYLPPNPSQINVWHEGGSTVATHCMSGGLYQTTLETAFLEDHAAPDNILSQSTFHRARHTLQARSIVSHYISNDGQCGPGQGIDHVYHVGSWCSRGIPLLEGCVSSALCVVKAIEREAGL